MQRRHALAAVSVLPVSAIALQATTALPTPGVITMPAPDLPSKPCMTLAMAKHLLQAAEAEATSKGFLMSVAIVDDGGHVWAVHRLEGAPPSTAAIATEKARTAALIRRPTKGFEDLINGGRTALLSIGSLQSMLDGGTPLMVGGHCIGAVGVSGGRPPDDNAVVEATLRALTT